MTNPSLMFIKAYGCLILAIVFMHAINGVESQSLVGARRRLQAAETIFDITKFGAKADGRTDNAYLINRAFTAACNSLGAVRLLIPQGNFVAGEVIFGGPCKSNLITIEIQGNLMAYDDLSVYAQSAWISVERVDNVIINGKGTLNARGKATWKYASGDSTVPLPVSLDIKFSNSVKVFDLSFVDSMGFHIKVSDSNDVAMWGLKINAPENSPSTDGVYVTTSTNVRVTDSIIGTGHNCITIGEGNDNVLVAKTTCGLGHGISVMGKRPEEAKVKGIIVQNCTDAKTGKIISS